MSVFLTGEIKAETEQQPGSQQGVVAKIRPITPEEKISFKYGEKMKWVQQCPFCPRWVGDLVEHVKNAHKRENFRQIKTRCPQPECGTMVVDIKNHITKVHEGVKNYQCEHCPARFVSNYNVKKHVESLHTDVDTRVQCGECNGSFKVSSLEGHVKRVHRGVKNAFPCPEEDCGKVFGSNADRDRHVLSFHKKWKAPCPECGKKLGVERLLSHIKVVHRGVYPFPCTRCERGFQNQKDLKTHTIVKHHGTFLYCKATSSEGVECKQVLFSEASMMKHVEKHHLVEGWETVPCPECPAVSLPCYLANHIHTAHTNILGVECVVEGCGDQFSGDDDLKHHLDTDHSSLCLEWCDQCSEPTINLTLHSKVMHDDEEPDFKPLFGVCLSQACSWKECSFMGHSSSHLANHVYSKHTRKTSMKCQECGMRTTNIPEHIRVHHTKVKTLVCEVCKKFFLKRAQLTKHMKNHGVRQKDTCAECGVEVINIRQHMRCVHERDLPFRCNMGCSTRFSSKYALKKHMESVHEGMRVECPKCFKMVVSLKKHIKIVHDKIRDHVCPLCQKTFQTRTHLRNHVTKVHLGLKDECPICGKHVQDLKNHHNFVHNKVANFPCDQCDRKCITSTALKMHVSSVHLGEKVECPVCGEKICKAYLNCHIRRQHQAREKFECELCGKPYTCRSYLAKHIKTVHMQLREICTVCGLETKDLYRHNRYTDCGKKGYVVRSRRGKQIIEIESSRRISRSLSRLACVSSDVGIVETTDLFEGRDLEHDEEIETEYNSSTATSPSSLLSRVSVTESGMFSPVSITDMKSGSHEEDFFIVSESGERLEEF